MKVGAKMKDFIKNAYDQIEIPDNLDFVINTALKEPKKHKNWIKYVTACAAAFMCFFSALNLSPSFAAVASDIPVLGNICKIFTVSHYDYSDESQLINITIPKIEVEGGPEWQNKLNKEIYDMIISEKEAAEAHAKEYYKAFLDTGGNPKDYHPVNLLVDYEIKYINKDYASFKVYKYEAMASSYTLSHYYNVDLNTGKLTTLKDWLGEDYINLVSKEVETQISQLSPNSKSFYFDDIDIKKTINENTNFYLTKDGSSLVVVFGKYEIAAGAAGEPEFTIPMQ